MDTKKLSLASMETLSPCLPCGNSGMEVYMRDLPPTHCVFEITGLSQKSAEGESEIYKSEIFEAGGFKWSLSLYPNGNKKQGGEGHISLYLNIEETNKLCSGWEVLINYKLSVYNQNNDCYLTIQDAQGAVRRFHERKKQWGFTQLLPLETLRNCSNGYLVDDTCIFGAEVFVLKFTTKPPYQTPQSNNKSNQVVISEPLPSVGTKITISTDVENRAGVAEVYEREQPPTHYSFEIKNFSLLEDRHYWSDSFEAGGFLWSLVVYPNGNKTHGGEGHISLYLRLEETSNLLSGWEAFVNYKLFILDQKKGCYLTIQDAYGKVRRFHKNVKEWGFAKLISHERLKQKTNGYLENDTCLFGAEVFVLQPTGKKGIRASLTQPQTSPNKLTFSMDNFSTLELERYESPIYHYGGYRWTVKVYPIGESESKEFGKSMSIRLCLVDARYLSPTSRLQVVTKLRVLDQLNSRHKEQEKTIVWTLNSPSDELYPSFMTLEDLRRPGSGFIHSDTVIVQVEFIRWTINP